MLTIIEMQQAWAGNKQGKTRDTLTPASDACADTMSAFPFLVETFNMISPRRCKRSV